MTLILLLALIGLGLIVRRQSARLLMLAQAIERLERRLDQVPAAVVPPVMASVPPAPAIVAPVQEPAPVTRAEPPRPDPARPPADKSPHPVPAFLFEQLVGARLPIWVGGAALAIAGYFLVRLAIESGLLTPGVRVLLATLFGFVLLAAAEAAARMPRAIGDPRINQSLAGAGIATLYAAAYLAGAGYGLIGPIAAFAMMAAITALALGLSIHRGAPTALMGLIGGFATPLLAGAQGGAIVPLIAYLGLLSAGLFGLAIARGWLWLALTAAAGSLLWSGLLIATANRVDALASGGFALLLAVAATLSLAASGGGKAGPVLRALPLAAGAAQLALLIALTGFGASAWALYLLLAAAAILLAWRDPRLTPAVAAALALSAFALVGSAVDADVSVAIGAAVGIALLFGGAGHGLARRPDDGTWWAGIGAAGLAVPLVALWTARPELLSDGGWSGVALLLALPPAHLAWRSRLQARAEAPFDLPLEIAAAAAAAFVAAALAALVPPLLLPAAVLVAAVALAGAGRHIGDSGLGMLSLAVAAVAGLLWILLETPVEALARIATGLSPVALEVMGETLLAPAILMAGLAYLHRGSRGQAAVAIASAVMAAAAVAAIVPVGWRALVLAGA
ncbi:MAG: hypothetical protein JWM75_2726, partial [Sphingomonas bacterium]|nr:hypothetical protein [Sphingomonas bacterium]